MILTFVLYRNPTIQVNFVTAFVELLLKFVCLHTGSYVNTTYYKELIDLTFERRKKKLIESRDGKHKIGDQVFNSLTLNNGIRNRFFFSLQFLNFRISIL